MHEIERQVTGINDNYSACCHGGQARFGGWSHGRLTALAILLVSLLLGVVACDTGEMPLEPETSSTEAAVEVNTVAASAVEPEAAKAEKIASAPEPAPAVISEKPLDLSYKPSAEDRQGYENTEAVISQETLLPEMFEPQEAAGKVSVSGGLLKETYEEGLQNDAVNGAEISLQVKTR